MNQAANSSTESLSISDTVARIFYIQKYSIHDGPGIRTTVFFKGCPLRCLWCCNPESQRFEREILFRSPKCDKCAKCLNVCDPGAISFQNDELVIDYTKCTGCLKCCAECPTGALTVSGEYITLDKLMEEVAKDVIFYDNSGGGVTASGGDPLAQWRFVQRFFQECKRKGISTAIETSGYASQRVLAAVLDYTDLVLYDVKHTNAEMHKKLTGRDNKLILENLHYAASRNRLWVRYPYIPGMNDDPDNLEALAKLAVEVKAEKISLLPYHSLGQNKYAQLGREYVVADIKLPEDNQIQNVKKMLEAHGALVTVRY